MRESLVVDLRCMSALTALESLYLYDVNAGFVEDLPCPLPRLAHLVLAATLTFTFGPDGMDARLDASTRARIQALFPRAAISERLDHAFALHNACACALARPAPTAARARRCSVHAK